MLEAGLIAQGRVQDRAELELAAQRFRRRPKAQCALLHAGAANLVPHLPQRDQKATHRCLSERRAASPHVAAHEARGGLSKACH